MIVALGVRPANPPVENAEDQELREGLVELGRMERTIERHAHQFVAPPDS